MRTALRRRACRTAGSSSDATELERGRATALDRRRPRGPRPGHRARRRFATPNARRRRGRRSPTGSRSSAAGSPLDRVGCYVPGRVGALSVVAGHDRRPGPGRRRRPIVVASPAGATARSTRPARRRGPAGVDALVVAGGAQAVGALAFGLPDAGLAPVDRIVGPGNAWVTAAKLEVSARGRHRPARRAVRGHGPRRRAADPVTRRG